MNEEKEVITKTIDQESLAELTKGVVQGLLPEVLKQVNENIDARFKEANKPKKKDVSEDVDSNYLNAEGKIVFKKMNKELRLLRAATALMGGDRETLRAYNEYALAARQKAGYNNSDTPADGGYIIADPLFEAEIESLSPNYGVAFQEADVRPTDRSSIKTNKRGNNVTMYELGQGAAKTVSKLTIEQVNKSLRKFAGIAIATDEMLDDAAIDFWADVTQGFAEERARFADQLIFTDTKVNNKGILHLAGTKAVSVGSAITSLNWGHLMTAQAVVPTKSRTNGKFYMHSTIWNILIQSQDDNHRYQWFPAMGFKTPWGVEVVLVDAMPSVTDVPDANEGYVIFGDLKRFARLYVKRGLELRESKDASLHDADNVAVNLYEQDMTALRAVVRMVAMFKFPEAFAVIGTGTVS